MIFLAIFILCALIAISGICVVNTLSFPRLRQASPARWRSVSLLVPARNEARVIGKTIRNLLQQDYPDYEVVLLDDDSTDGTLEIARQAAQGDQRFRPLSGLPLPDGWTGKNWACHQLAQAAQGEVLVFTDADVHWQPAALRSLMALMERTHADAVTVWPAQHTVTWAERLVVPTMTYAIMAYLPELGVRYIPLPAFAAANGQCLAFHRQAYERSGGHAAVRSKVVEDVALARAAKRAGMRLVMALGQGMISARMYTNWQKVRDGFAKSILEGHGGTLLLCLSALLHWLIFVYPWAWLALGGGWSKADHDAWLGWPLMPLAMIALGVGVRLLSAAATRHRLEDSFWMPVSVVLLTLIAVQSLWWHYRYGGPQWKGRRIAASVPRQVEGKPRER